jgi:hypothetical protein
LAKKEGAKKERARKERAKKDWAKKDRAKKEREEGIPPRAARAFPSPGKPPIAPSGPRFFQGREAP